MLQPFVQPIDHDDLADAGVTLVEVHPDHLAADWFGTWSNHFGHEPPGPIRVGNRDSRLRGVLGEHVRVHRTSTYDHSEGMAVTASALRRDIYRILDRVVESGEPVITERNGRRVRIPAEDVPSRLDALVR